MRLQLTEDSEPQASTAAGVLDWFQANAWLLTLLSIVIGGTITITIYFKNKRQKTLDYEVVSNVALLSSRADIGGKQVEVSVGGRVVKNPRIITLKFVNTGNVEILEDDFLSSIKVNKDMRTYHLAVKEGSGVAPRVKISSNDWEPPEISADCLNPGEYLEVQYLVEDWSADVTPTCRITGATRPMRDMSVRRYKRINTLGVVVFVGIFVSLIGILGSITDFNLGAYEIISTFLLSSLGFFLVRIWDEKEVVSSRID